MATATRSTRPPAVDPSPSGVPRWALYSLLATIGAFLAVSVWWIVADSSILDWDSGRHVRFTWDMRTAIGDGDLLAPITQDNLNHYPPLLYLVGSLGMVIGGWQSIDSAMLAMNFVFVPLLALGCWGVARLAYGELAGVLAAVFALGTPIVVSAFHLYMLDVPQAAMVATTIWLVLLSRRFERVGISALAGAAGAGALLLKPTSVIFLTGAVAVVLLRGGWKRPAGLAAFFGVGAILCGPWYLDHWDQVRGLTSGAVAASTGPPGGGAGGGGGPATTYITPARISDENATWYAWNLLNVQLLAPLFLAFVAGTVVAVVRFWRTRDPHDYTPELVIGGLFAYLGMTYLTLKDARYTLPALVFVAALGVAWVPALKPHLRKFAAGGFAAVAAVNLIGISLGIGGLVAIKGPDSPDSLLGERSVRFYSAAGYLQSAPRDDADALRVMKDLREEGIEVVELDPGGDPTFSLTGLQALVSIAGLRQPPRYDPADLAPDTPFLTRHPFGDAGPRPCGVLDDGQGFFVVRQQNVVVPFEDYEIDCPRPG